MHLTGAWIGLLVAGGVGAVALTALAAAVRREVAALQRSMRPLRVKAGKSDRRSL